MALYSLSLAAGLLLLALFWPRRFSDSKKTKLPILRADGIFRPTRTSIEYFFHGHELFREGYAKFKSTGFQIFPRGRPEIYLTDPKLLEEVAGAPEDYISGGAYINEMIQGRYTVPGHFEEFPMPKDFAKPSFYALRMQTLARRRLGGDELFDEIWDEIKLAHKGEPIGADWTPVAVSEQSRLIIARTANRAFVGKSLCRNKEYLDCMVNFATTIILTAEILKCFPKFLKPYVSKVIRNTEPSFRLAGKYLEPLIEDYQAAKRNGPPPEQEMFLHWLVDAGKEEDTPEWRQRIIRQMVVLNFGSIHTSSMHLTKCILQLACHPEYLAPLREEIRAEVINGGGWSNTALDKMWKLDSFLKEVQRVSPHGVVALQRIALRAYTLSDGTYIPEGALVGAPVGPMLEDEENYTHAKEFDGFRFSKLREQGKSRDETAFSSTSPLFCSFGHGKHACPGRFFASQEIRLMLAYVILSYDLKLKDGKKPANIRYNAADFPHPKAQVMMRARTDDLSILNFQ